MLRNKRILLIIIVAIALFLIPNVCNATAITAKETTTTSTGKIVKWSYELNEDDEIINLLCTNVDSISGEVVIPSTIDGKVVRQISKDNKGIFANCQGLTGVTIPDGVTNIRYESFYNCISLKKVTIPNTVITIGRYVFYNCKGLTEINIPDSVITIGEYAFDGCTSLTKLTLSNSMTVLNENVFAECKGLKSVIIPNSVTTICGTSYDGAFYNCINLEKVLIPDNVSVIEDYAFQGCSKLTIFGNDNQVSKKHAEDNNINFNYIANWDNTQTGADIVPPTLERLRIVLGAAFEKDKGTGYYLAYVDTNISIKATFNEEIHGKEAPTLTIKCGNGDNIILDEGVIQGKYIVYTYRIQDKDKGIISAVSLTGGDIADAAGNKIEKYTCPELTTDIWNEQVFANGTGTIVNNQGNVNNGSNNENNDNGSTITLASIAITKASSKLVYTEGEKFDKTGMVITATYSNGSTKQITNYTVSPSQELKTTDTKIVISYTENGVTKTVEQAITVNEKPVATTLTSIAITKAPTKTSYTEGNTFSKNGMVVTAIYSDGTKKEITSYSISPSGKLKTTDKKVTIAYTEAGVTKTVDQSISVARKATTNDNDSTTKDDDKLPQTGVTLLSLIMVTVVAVAIISKVKYRKYKDI